MLFIYWLLNFFSFINLFKLYFLMFFFLFVFWSRVCLIPPKWLLGPRQVNQNDYVYWHLFENECMIDFSKHKEKCTHFWHTGMLKTHFNIPTLPLLISFPSLHTPIKEAKDPQALSNNWNSWIIYNSVERLRTPSLRAKCSLSLCLANSLYPNSAI